MTTDLKTFILELAERKPNMRAYSMAREIRKFEKNWALQQENYHRQLVAQYARDQHNMAMHLEVSKPRGWLQRIAELF